MNRVWLHGLAAVACAAVFVWSQPAPASEASANSAPLPPASQRFAAENQAGKQPGEVPDFRRHIEPLFGRLGCNGRACHGSFQGRGGFHLSLFGYDAPADHKALLESTDGKVNVKHPTESLILQKPTLTIDHEGGLRMKRGGWEYRLLLRWIESGAKPAGAAAVDVERLEISPAEIQFNKPGETAQLRAIVHWTDGSSEDVTPICRYQSNDDSLAKVDRDGLVTCLGRGDTQVVAFYDNGITPVPVFLPVSDLVGPRYPTTPTANRVDELVLNKLKKLGITQSPLADDAEFLRRASLDATGTLPSPDEIRAFLADRSPDKRARKIIDLLDRPAYAAWWATRLCDLTGNNAAQIDWFDPALAASQWYEWMYDRLRRNVPYDKIAAGLLLADSRASDEDYAAYCRRMVKYDAPDGHADAAALPTMPFYWSRRNVRRPDDIALSFCYTFLGVQMQCCQCHKHPFDRWTKQDFDDFSRFFSRVGYGIAPTDQTARQAMIASLRDSNETAGGGKADARAVAKADATIAAANAAAKSGSPSSAEGNAGKTAAKTVQTKIAAAAKVARKINFDLNKLLIESAQQGKVIPLQEVFILPKPAAATAVRNDPAKRDSAKNKSAGPMQRPIPAANAKLLGGETVDLNQLDDPRQALVDWLQKNPKRYFARVMVNRVWANYFNVGIIQPTDDLNQAHPPSNPELLDNLTSAFVEHGYDLKWLHREIMNSRTYQLSWQPNDTNRLDERNFSHAIPRRLPAEVAYDALRLATAGSAEWKAAAEHPIDRAIGLDSPTNGRPGKQRLNGNRYALAVFGKPRRTSNCDCERSMQPSLLQTFFLQNDQETLGLLDRDGGWLAEALGARGEGRGVSGKGSGAKGQRPDLANVAPHDSNRLVEEAFLRTLSRPPSPAELARGREAVAAGETPKAGLRDLLWALVNTKEFILNH